MKLISSRLHGILDYLTVIAFALAPTVLGLTGTAAWLAYTLAVAHLLVTLATDFDLGVAHLLPAAWHGRIELAVGLLLLVAPWLLGFSDDATARTFFIAAGVVILIVWALTAYRGRTAAEDRTAATPGR
jgi:SPW repeat